MSIYKRDEVLPEWEPIPYDLKGIEADAQELGFHARAMKPISWTPVPRDSFPDGGLLGHERDWFIRNEIECFATFEGEDLVLIRNPWHGFPDPPEWGLASRPTTQHYKPWAMWGHVPSLPVAWNVPLKDLRWP